MRGKIIGAALAAFVALPAFADTIAVIGTGNVAGALGPEFAAQGHTIVYGSRARASSCWPCRGRRPSKL